MDEKIKVAIEETEVVRIEDPIKVELDSTASPHFLVCPKCLSAFPGESLRSIYSCSYCKNEWQPPLNSLGYAYFANIDELIVSLVDTTGDEFVIKKFPTTVGRNSDFKILQSNVSVSRQHCLIDYNSQRGHFFVVPFKTGGGTYLNGRNLKPDDQYPFFPGDTLVLSGVVLQLRCKLRKERGVAASGFAPSSSICLHKEASTGFLCSAAGNIIFTDQQSQPAIAYCSYNSEKARWTILALDRRKIMVNGEIFVEKELSGGEFLAIEGKNYLFDAYQSRLVPAAGDKGVSIQVKNLKAGYGKTVILGDISCHIPKGKLTAILGQSGCGKSTLIKILSGQKKQLSGTIFLDESDLSYSQWAEENLALVPQHDVIHSELSVKQCIEYAADIRLGKRTSSSVKEAMVDRVLHDAGIWGIKDSLISDLSGGQRKRVNIAVELTGHPQVLLLDEPTTGLDYATEKQIIAELHQLSRQGKTIVFVTHSLATIEAADHVIVLKNTRYGSRVAAEGTPEDVQKSIGIESWEELYSSINLTNKSADSSFSEKTFTYRAPGMSALFSRYLTIWMNFPLSSLALLLGLPLLLGIMIRFAVSIDAPMGMDRLIFGLVAMFWMGMNQTVREIVKEKDIFIQEHARHVTSWNYLSSKLIFFLLTTLPQAFLMTVPIMWINVNTDDFFIKFNQLTCSFIDVLPMMWVAGFIGCVLGLLFSSVSLFIKGKGEIAAVLFAVIATLPQFLFSAKVLPDGLAKPLKPEHFYQFICWHENAPIAEFLSFFTFSRYLYIPLDAISAGLSHAIIIKSFVFNCGILAIVTLTIIILTWLILELFATWHTKE